MNISTNVEKIRTLYGGKLHNFVSYFQSVTTVGIITTARNPNEAESLAKKRMAEGKFVSGIFNQSPYTISETEQWQPKHTEVDMEMPKIQSEVMDGSFDLMLTLSEKTVEKIAAKLNKPFNEVSEEDCLNFLKNTLDTSLA